MTTDTYDNETIAFDENDENYYDLLNTSDGLSSGEEIILSDLPKQDNSKYDIKKVCKKLDEFEKQLNGFKLLIPPVNCKNYNKIKNEYGDYATELSTTFDESFDSPFIENIPKLIEIPIIQMKIINLDKIICTIEELQEITSKKNMSKIIT
jgi:hypothetical protein